MDETDHYIKGAGPKSYIQSALFCIFTPTRSTSLVAYHTEMPELTFIQSQLWSLHPPLSNTWLYSLVVAASFMVLLYFFFRRYKHLVFQERSEKVSETIELYRSWRRQFEEAKTPCQIQVFTAKYS